MQSHMEQNIHILEGWGELFLLLWSKPSISASMIANTWTIRFERWPSKLHHTHDYLHAVTADQFDLQGHPTTKMDWVDFQGYAQGESV